MHFQTANTVTREASLSDVMPGQEFKDVTKFLNPGSMFSNGNCLQEVRWRLDLAKKLLKNIKNPMTPANNIFYL